MLTNEHNIGVWNVIKSKSANLCRVLRKQMFDYCKVVNKGQRDLIMMDMIRRVECNSYSIMLLSEQSLQGNGSTYLKFSFNDLVMLSTLGYGLSAEEGIIG